METPHHYQNRVTIERYAERAALFQIRGATFLHCLRLNNLASECSVVQGDGKKVTLRGQDLANRKAWESFLQHYKLSLSWLSYEAGTIAARYAQWLRTSYTERYRVITTDEEIVWLQQVARLAVLWRLMWQKYDTHGFLDSWVESEMGKLLLRDLSQEMAKAVHHGNKDPEQATALLEQAYEYSLSLMADRTFASYGAEVTLPPGTADPLALPEENEGNASYE